MDYLKAIEDLLDMPAGRKADAMRELTSHFDELYDDLRASGMSPAEADAEAQCRMGRVSDIAASLNAAHNSASWKSTVIAVAPFGASALYLLASALRAPTGVMIGLAALIGIVMLFFSVRELIRDRRPIWLPTWLAQGLICIGTALSPLGASTHEMEGQIACACLVIVAVAILFVACRAAGSLPKLVIFSGVIATVFAVMATVTNHWIPVLGMGISALVLVMLIAFLVFKNHRYGGAAQASLFLLGLFVIGPRESACAPEAWINLLILTATLPAVIWYIRMPDRPTKATAAYVALFTCALSKPVVGLTLETPNCRAIGAIFSAALFALIAWLIVGWPMRREQAERNRLRFAR